MTILCRMSEADPGLFKKGGKGGTLGLQNYKILQIDSWNLIENCYTKNTSHATK